jgi:hypothetical protein
VANPNLDAAALQAGLKGKQKEQVQGLSKLLDSHRALLALPENQAKASFESLPEEQQKAHIGFFGDNKASEKPSGFLGSARHYLGLGVKETIGRVFSGLNEVSDFSTRIARTGLVALDQGVDLSTAFKIANDKGDKVFSPDRIAAATEIYGEDTMSVAMKVASGITLSEIQATGSEAEKLIASTAAQKKDKDRYFTGALDAAQRAKYSPGRAVANLILPEFLEKTALYKGISGVVDAGYRIFADPFLILGKAKKAYDAGDFLLYNILGKEKFTYGRNLMATAGNVEQVDRVFSNPATRNLFDKYGAALGKLDTARKSQNKIAGAEAYQEARRLIPEFGPAGIDELIVAGVKDADTAAKFLKNHADIKSILSGQAARKTPLVPTLNTARKARVTFFTTANKVFNIDKAGQNIVKSLYGDGEVQDVISALTEKTAEIAKLESKVGRKFGKVKDGSIRLSPNQISGRIDRFVRKFTTIPYFKNGFFDVMTPDASEKIYQLAALTNTRYHSRIIQEAFAAGNEGQRKQIFTGLWNTIAETRQVTKTIEGKNWVDQFSGTALDYRYAATTLVDKLGPDGKPLIDELGNVVREVFDPANFDGQQLALHGYQLSTAIAVPSILDLDRLSARSGLINRMLGISHKKWADDTTSYWVVGTLAGPKFPVRNAAEDLMLNIATGQSVWGITKGRFLSTKLRQIKEAEAGLTVEQKRLGQEIANLRDETLELAKDTKNVQKVQTNKALIKEKTETLKGLEGKQIKFYESNLGFVNRLVGRNQVKEFQVRLAAAGDDINKVRAITAEAIMTGKLSSRVLSKKQKQYLQEFSQYGRTQDILDEVTEGGKNTLRGGGYSIQASNDAKRYGTLRAIEYDGKKLKQSGSTFTDIDPVANDQSRLSWLVKIALHTNDEIDSVIIKNLDNKKQAIDDLVKYLDENPELRDRFQSISSGVVTTAQHAERVYLDVLNTFSKADGTLNKDLWNKIRKVREDGDIALSSRNLSIDDLPAKSQKDMHPRWISGPTLVPVSEGQNMPATIVERLWDYMGEANARFSREAIVLDSMLDVRSQMDETGFAERILKQFTAGKTGDDLVKAETKAFEHITSLAEDMAKNRVLSYVDNPAVRSQLAMSARNFARFYRATEDFYRRLSRTVKYNPDAIVRASLTYEGVAHSGFVQTDENGDQYFFYPGLTPVYQVMNKVGRLFGVKDGFQTAMPIEFGAKLKMITPSLNPDSLFPTFAGPLAAVPLKMLGNVVPQVKDLEQYLLGAYGVDQPMISAILPAHVNRIYAALSKDERNSQYASAYRKAATYLEATGHGLKPVIDPETGEEIPPSPGELSKYKDKLEASTVTVMAVRALFGFILPASPSVQLKSDMAKWVRDNGQVSYKSAFNDLINRYGDVNKATEEWIKYYPDQMPYTVSESESNVAATVRAVDGAVSWVDTNKKLLEKYPEAASFLIPNIGEFDFNAYKLLFKSGIKSNKTITDFLREVSVAKDRSIYYAKRNEFEEQMSYTADSGLKRQIREEWETWADEYKGARPLLQEQLGLFGERAIQRSIALDDLRNMLNDPEVTTQGKLRSILSEMVTVYDDYVNQRDFNTSVTIGNKRDYQEQLRIMAKTTLQELAESDPNAQAAYNSLFDPLFN